MSDIDVLVITALKEEYEAARKAAMLSNGCGVSKWDDAGASHPILIFFKIRN
jgi:hypothetical protein